MTDAVQDGTNPTGADPTEDALTNRRKRLLFRSWHRGTRESDLLIGSFAEAHLDHLSADQLDRFEALLEENDPDIYDWMNGRAPIPERVDHDVMRMMVDFRFTPRQGS